MTKSVKKLLFDDLVPGIQAFHLAQNSRPGQALYIHTHDFYECFLVVAGEGTHVIQGQRLDLYEGDLVFIRPDDVHGFESQHLTIINLAFSSAHFARVRDLLPDKLSRLWHDQVLPSCLSLNQIQTRTLAGHFQDLSRQADNEINLFRFLLGLLQVVDLPAAGDCPDWLSEALIQIEAPENFQKGVSGFVALCYRSSEHVSRSCRRYLGKSVSAIVNDARLNYAASCLGTGDMDILDISMECGFKSLAQFYKLFKLKFKMTPRQYRLARMQTLI